MIGYYNYTVIATYFSLISAVLGVSFSSRGKIFDAVVCLLICGGLDMIDGKIAATKKRTQKEKRFGIQIDSLSDLVAFGVLPGSICIAMCDNSIISLVVMCLYVLCALIRLAYFNVDEEERQNTETGRRKTYEGLPVTSAAISFPLMFVLSLFFEKAKCPLAIMFSLVSAVLFIFPFKLKKPETKHMILFLLIGIAILSVIIIKIIPH